MSIRTFIQIVESAETPDFANGWWVLPDGRIEECRSLGSHAATAARILGAHTVDSVVTLKGQGAVRCAVFWTPNPSQPTSMNIDLVPDDITDAAKRGLLRLMAQTRDLFDGYYFEHLWTQRQDNGQRDYREAMAEVRGLRIPIQIMESMGHTVPILYHGTCPANASSLIQNGWAPGTRGQGANMGQSRFLYLSTGREDALWFAEQKGCNTVVEVRGVPIDHLMVDPEDGTWDTIEDELAGHNSLPGKVVLTKPLLANHFHLSNTVSESTGRKSEPEVVPDDGDVPHALAAFFDDDAYVRFWKTKTGALVIQSMHASEDVRGRDMLRWIKGTYGLPIIVVEVTPEARGFWSRMKQEGLVDRFSMATGTASPLERQSVPLAASASRKSALTESVVPIDIVDNNGGAEGYVVDSSREQLVNWLEHRHGINDDDLLHDLRSRYPRIAMFNNLNVDEDARGQGIGTDLFDGFRGEALARGADAILLMADTSEENSFDLVAWYERQGCKIIRQTSGGPLMVLEL